MILTKAQSEIAEDTHRFRVANCGRRFGKTRLAVEEMKGKSLAKSSKLAYIAPTLQQARDIAWAELKRELAPALSYENESRLEMRVYSQDGGESTIWLRGWEAVETLRGQSFDFLVIDEISSMRNWDENWQWVLRPTLTDRKGEVLFISTPKGFNHFYELFGMEAKDADYRSFHFTSYDNPHVPKEEIDKARAEMDENSFAQEYLADFRKAEGLVYREFSRERHVERGDRRDWQVAKRHVGIDWGFTNPSAVLEVLEDRDGIFHVASEWYERQKTKEQVIAWAKSLKGHAHYPDPEDAEGVRKLDDAVGNVIDVNKDVLGGIDTVRSLLKQGRLMVHESCRNLILEFETYHYRERRNVALNEPEEPEKSDDHCLDALRYVLHMAAEGTGRKASKSVSRRSLSSYRYGSNWNRNVLGNVTNS